MSTLYKEQVSEIRALPRHPWEITLREFIEIVLRSYGIEIDPASAAVAGGWFLSKDRRPYPVPVIGLDDLMSVYLLGCYCRFYRIPPEDFGLPAEEDD
jgi:hypothetical protein